MSRIVVVCNKYFFYYATILIDSSRICPIDNWMIEKKNKKCVIDSHIVDSANVFPRESTFYP